MGLLYVWFMLRFLLYVISGCFALTSSPLACSMEISLKIHRFKMYNQIFFFSLWSCSVLLYYYPGRGHVGSAGSPSNTENNCQLDETWEHRIGAPCTLTSRDNYYKQSGKLGGHSENPEETHISVERALNLHSGTFPTVPPCTIKSGSQLLKKTDCLCTSFHLEPIVGTISLGC